MQLNLHYDIAAIRIYIGDNGSGFDEKLMVSNRNAGLHNIQTRVKMLQGSMQMESYPNGGTKLFFNIPFSAHG